MAGPRLQVRDAASTRTVAVDRTPFTIGRREANSLQLTGTEVSREHAEIVEEEGRYLLRDRQSRYGTFVGGEAITECELRPGDQIRLGRSGGADLLFLGEGDEGTLSGESTPGARDGLRQMTDLLERLRGLGSGRVLQDVLTLVLDSALDISRAQRGFIMLADAKGKLDFRLARARAGQTLSDVTFETSRKIPEEVFRTGQTRVVRDLFQLGVKDDHSATTELGIRHVVCVPLNLVQYVESMESRAENRRIGVLYLDSHEKGTLVSAATRSTLETLAGEASVAIENARLYRGQLEKARMDQEMRIAAKIQQALMPQSVVCLPYLEAAAASIPCRSIGGDFFDYLNQSGLSFRFSLGDVAGKGPPAALMSAMMQGMFAFAAQATGIDSPASVVTNINQAMCQRAVEARFVTLLLGVLTAEGRLISCNAGHNPPFVVGASGVRRLDAGGPVVGLLESATYEQETLALDPGDVIVVFNDGVSEALNAGGEEFGEARLLETIEGMGACHAQALVEGVLDAVRAFTKSAVQSDDITMMAIRYLGQHA